MNRHRWSTYSRGNSPGSGRSHGGVVTKPFSFEGKRRMKQAEKGTAELKDKVDTLITIPNDRCYRWQKKTSIIEAFRMADDVLLHGVQGISI